MGKCKYNCKNGRIFIERTGTFVDCPECKNIKKTLTSKNEDGISIADILAGGEAIQGETSIYDILNIPSEYKGYKNLASDILTTISNNYSSNSVSKVSALLEHIRKGVSQGKVARVSCYIHIPLEVDIKKYIYSTQKFAIEQQMSVVPLISANVLYGIQKVGDYSIKDLREINMTREGSKYPTDIFNVVDGYRFIEFSKLSYFDFIHADICFIDATANTTEKGWIGLADLLSERAKQGLPTYVFGYWPHNAISKSGLKYLINPSDGNSRLNMLTPYEVQRKGSKDAGTSIATIFKDEFETTKEVKAGITSMDNMI